MFTTGFSMIAPEEVVSNRVLPTLRAMVAKDLAARGLTERQIGESLGLTQSAVSKYLRGRIRLERSILESPTFTSLAARVSEGFSNGTLSSFEALGLIIAAVRRGEDRGVVCRLHEELEPALAGLGCDLCIRGEASERLAEEEVLSDLRAALRALESHPQFAGLIPKVGSNLARAKRGATTTLDVAAVPGRIFEMRGAVRVPSAPEFGVSRHVAEVVLGAMGAYPSLQAALNIRWDDEVRAAARQLGWSVVEFDAAYEGRRERIATVVRRARRRPDILAHGGAFAVEPVAYLVGDKAVKVVERTLALLSATERQ